MFPLQRYIFEPRYKTLKHESFSVFKAETETRFRSQQNSRNRILKHESKNLFPLRRYGVDIGATLQVYACHQTHPIYISASVMSPVVCLYTCMDVCLIYIGICALHALYYTHMTYVCRYVYSCVSTVDTQVHVTGCLSVYMHGCLSTHRYIHLYIYRSIHRSIYIYIYI